MSHYVSTEVSVAYLIQNAAWNAKLSLSPQKRKHMEEGALALSQKLAAGCKVYGITQGFGPLVRFDASPSSSNQGMGLISHLATGQGKPLTPDVTRFMLWLRLQGMTQGHSAVSPDFWLKLAELWNRGFTPVVPRDGSVSASGDLIPLAHAALAFAGIGEAWSGSPDSGWTRIPAKEALSTLGVEPIVWPAREALAFVNGTTVSLAATCYNYQSIYIMARALAALSGRIAYLLGANPEPYTPKISLVRGQPGQIRAAKWIRAELTPEMCVKKGRPLQEPYSLRCAPQVIGAVIDHLSLQESILVQEALGCTDNPVVCDGEVLHGGNFHALPVALCSDQQALCLQQLAFLAERQLALLLNPEHNGGKPPMLTPNPGPTSGLAGVQIAATSFVSKIRQLAYPATLTSLPTNLGNQDHVPMALNGANTVAETIQLAWLVIGSLALALNQWTHLEQSKSTAGTVWAELQARFKPLDTDLSLAEDVHKRRN
ncbi:aromatic amino acid ammonia-lyase [Nostoc sp. CHAB 5784]|uniref:aromatic amino acid ammonia-lyase n=1 Tax=Nostoc mirabile TaxID=2907820 RepID=UPI001E3D5F90|nr:aromatic amino acid ammonia-lyase [Nostoc mirabile]MCC5670641.1 aromatic amino acid ammonia-lyase [Nostoc mirabile CHAB5784]